MNFETMMRQLRIQWFMPVCHDYPSWYYERDARATNAADWLIRFRLKWKALCRHSRRHKLTGPKYHQKVERP